MGLGSLGNGILWDTVSSAVASVHDNFVIDRNTGVTITLRNVDNSLNILNNLPLAGAISFNIQAKYVAPFENFTGILDAANKFLTGGLGISYRQPWFNYRVWQSTDPIGFSIPLVFTATLSAKAEVWDPVLALIRLVLPKEHSSATLSVGVFERGLATGLNTVVEIVNLLPGVGIPQIDISGSPGGRLSAFIPPGPNFAHSLARSGTPFANVFQGAARSIREAFGGEGVEASRGQRLARYQIEGLPVSVRVGNYIHFHTCYVDTVSVNIDPQMSPDGFPLKATAEVAFRSMNAPFMNRYGQIVLDMGGFEGNADTIAGFLQ